MSKKDKMVDGAPRKLCVSHPRFVGLILAWRGRSSGEQTWKLIWNEHKLLHGVTGPIFTLNDYLNTVFDSVVSLRGSCKIILPREKFDLKIFDHAVSLKTLIALSRSPYEKVERVDENNSS